MSKFVNSYDALSALVNCDMAHEDRKEAEKMIEEDIRIAERVKKLRNTINIQYPELFLEIFGTTEDLILHCQTKLHLLEMRQSIAEIYSEMIKTRKKIGEKIKCLNGFQENK